MFISISPESVHFGEIIQKLFDVSRVASVTH